MPHRLWLALCLLAATLAPDPAAATQVWSGRTLAFSKAAFADPTLATHQDRITPQVWITRGSSQGIYNIHQESAYTHNVSPAGTEWATGDAVNHAALTFRAWEVWANGTPPATVGVHAVVHLIAEDIYVDIVFDTWGGSGGAFSYHRAPDPGLTPSQRDTWGRIKQLFR
jgi:hypothetical protein